MSDELVTVTVVKWHTRGGIVQPVNTTYDVPAAEVENLVAQGLVTVNAAAAPKAKATSKPVAPLTTHDLKTTEVKSTRRTSLAAKPAKARRK